ncbi:gamma-glutamylcyclotransferase family protein [Streptomyces paludis]|uniref:Gamma-glutamylcyclotransferase n=1 Tax=Streptomyces paludis TaxID=2282738 RepID=A0A345HLZ6_9ACTN|nr:gamma-glutamylcyclotransferase family protein [Streptomyces paludis]AXG77720.1 gamma-glutamylcyclotransferase [Streptomyces paludis]
MTITHLPFFVYGTLRPGGFYHDRFLAGRTVREEPALLAGALLYDGPGYPYATEEARSRDATSRQTVSRETVTEPPRPVVVGELVTAEPARYDELLAALDELEDYLAPGHPGNVYDRVARDVHLATGATARAWVYLAAPRIARELRASGRRIEGGDWMKAMKAMEAMEAERRRTGERNT